MVKVEIRREIFSFGILIILLSSSIISCNKLVEIPPPTTSITTSEVFSDSANSSAAISGLYESFIGGGNPSIGNGAITLYCGLSSDELATFYTDDNDLFQLYTNTLQPTNQYIQGDIFQAPYKIIYKANAIIEGVEASKGLSDSQKRQFIGEAEFVRSLVYFYLVNLFGDVPLVTSTDWAKTNNLIRANKQLIYQKIVTDLIDAKASLLQDYAISGGEKVRANRWAASALLARVYLYTQDWKDAETESDSIIKNGNLFSLAPDLNDVFKANNSEAILQWRLNTNYYPFNVTVEARNFIPVDSTYNPDFYLNAQFLDGFEAGDKRKQMWIDSTDYQGIKYFIPYKYKVGPANQSVGGTASEYYMVLRLAEQYLIRAEARAQQNKLADAIGDLNIIRSRAGLAVLSATLSKPQVIDAAMQERKVELFAEWGHRWLDLKRTGKIDSVMTLVTPQKNNGNQWQTHQQLYPIPSIELASDPSLVQNPGY